MSGADVQAIVIDAGSFNTKAGFAGDDAPRVLFPTVVSESLSSVGDEAISKGEALVNPIANGTVTNWDALKKIFWHVFYTGLNIAPEEHPFVLAESPFTSTADREAIARLMFEEYSVPALDIVPDAVLVAYQAGCVTGLVIDVGNESARIVPVVEGKCLAQTARQVDLADLWNALASLLQNFDEGTQGKLCSSVILSGGNQNPTIADELHDAIVGMVAGSISVKIINPAHREFSVWEGGTIVGSNCAFFSKEQYDEDDGASALNGKYYA